ncbi:tetratricopeptide (TPR) repeat protein [Sporosarcina luteola]|nr:tetratricopeptide (TPR) repeat protein [Sporosarcina luteola]
MTRKEIDFLNSIEINYPVNKWRIEKVDIWPFLRIMLGLKLANVLRPISNQDTKNNSPGKLPTLSSLLRKNEKIDVFVLIDSFPRIKLNGSWYHRLSGPFNEEIRNKGLNVVNLEFSYHNIERFPVFDESYSITNQLKYIQNNIQINKIVHLEKYEQVKREFLLEYGEEFDFPTIEYLTTSAMYIQKLSNVFETLFLEKKTKAAFMVNYYQQNSYAFILAARRVGIPSIDIQHGNQRDICYHRWLNVPENGYNILPDYFWCWEKKDASTINNWADLTKSHQAINGGNPWIEMWKDNNQSIVDQYDQTTKQYIDENQVNILVTLQPLYGLPNWNSNIPDWVVEAIQKSPANWKWYIRYHPQMLGNYRNEMESCEAILAPYISSGKVETKKATHEPLMAILRKMTVHITAFSTCVIESMNLHVPSVTIHDRAEAYFKEELASGWVIQATDTEELLTEVQSFILKRNEKKLTLIHSDIIGLDKGLELILNSPKKVMKIVSNLNISRNHKEIYMADGRYEQIINEYESNPLSNEVFIVGKAYEELNHITKAISCYDEYISNLSNNNQKNINLKELLHLKDFCQKYNSTKEVQIVDSYINKIINKNENLKSSFLKQLLQSGRYNEIKEWKDKVEKSIDTSFYVGRALLALGDTEEGIKELLNYLEKSIQPNNQMFGQTLQRNYKASAYFYLGEANLNMHKFEDARYYFEQCNLLMRGQHEKAKAYLKMYKK